MVGWSTRVGGRGSAHVASSRQRNQKKRPPFNHHPIYFNQQFHQNTYTLQSALFHQL